MPTVLAQQQAMLSQCLHVPAGISNALFTIIRTEGAASLFKGLSPALIGTAPYAALNFAAYDLLKNWVCDGGSRRAHHHVPSRMIFFWEYSTLAFPVQSLVLQSSVVCSMSSAPPCVAHCRSMTTVGNLGLGAASGLVASSICFPLDTVRRQMQMRTCAYTSQLDAMSSVWRKVACYATTLPWAHPQS